MLQFHFTDSFEPHPRVLAFDRPERVVTARTLAEVRPAIAAIEAATKNGRYAAGYIGYEASAAFDVALRAKQGGGETTLPLLWFGIYRQPVPPISAGLAEYAVGAWQADTSRGQYEAAIATVRNKIADGEIYQANYTLRLRAPFTGNALAWFDDLQREAAVQFAAYLDIGSHQLLSLSPELFFAWDGRHLRTRPMKGTAQRAQALDGDPAPPDLELAEALRQSEKNRAENLMIVDLLRNDVSRVARPGTVAVPQLFSLETYPTVYQMTSTVTAETRAGTTLTDLLRALFPCGSITGAPKVKATEVLAELENAPRGAYCGAIGYVAPGGSCVFNVAIRTIVVDPAAQSAECGVGGGIVWDSIAAEEYAEAMAKAQFIARASQGFKLIETLRLSAGRYDWRERHLDRLCRSALLLHFAIERSALEQALERYAATHTGATLRVRLRVAGNGAIELTGSPAEGAAPDWFQPAIAEPKMVALARTAIESKDATLVHKTTRRSLYERHRRLDPDAFDVLLWNEHGELTEFTIGNLVLQLDDIWYTPPASAGLLRGVLREELLARGVIVERTLFRDDLTRATAIGFINSVRGWLPVQIVALV